MVQATLPCPPPPSWHGQFLPLPKEIEAFFTLSLSPVLIPRRALPLNSVLPWQLLLHKYQDHCPQLPILMWRAAKRIIGDFFFFFESRGPKASDQVQIIWRMCVSRTLSISLMGGQIKAWFRMRVGEAQDSSASELGELFQRLFDVKEMLEVV